MKGGFKMNNIKLLKKYTMKFLKDQNPTKEIIRSTMFKVSEHIPSINNVMAGEFKKAYNELIFELGL